MTAIWDAAILNPIFNVLVIIYAFIGNLGLAIILFTIIVKAVMIPVTLPSIKMSKKQRDVQPEIEKIKEKYKHDQKKMAQMQMELMRKHGINPASGCLTTIITIVFMIAVYKSVIIMTNGSGIDDLNNRIYFQNFRIDSQETINTRFLYLDLAKPDPYLIIVILSVILQFLATKMMMPYSKISEKAVKKTPGKTDDIIQSMQKQNLYIMPLMFFFFGLTLPSGVMIYIAVSTLFQIVQTYFFTGWGGLEPWVKKLGFAKTKR
ncbi:MAG: membrane protein insertase YidC [Patescibacteria group bacterium]|nr:MAG: membrane protein insertase YidC [Patescibacteria group bacterium]